MVFEMNVEEKLFIEHFRRISLLANPPKFLSPTLQELQILLERDYASDDDFLNDVELLNNFYSIYNRRNIKTTMFHDAIECESLQTLKKVSAIPTPRTKLLQQILSTACNNRGDTLLHHVCRLRLTKEIIHEVYELVSPWTLIQQNTSHQTPVHMALLEASDSPTFKAFMDILQKHTPDEVLIKLLRLYDFSGRTALQLAVLQNNLEFVDFMLSFCCAKNLDVCQIGTLGSGETLLHLAVRNGLDKMEQLILMHVPKAATQVNYAGYDAYGKCKFDNYDTDEDEDQDKEE